MPLSTLCLYSYLRARVPGVQIKMIHEWNETSLQSVREFGAQLVGISAFTPGYERATEIAKEIKASLPNVVTVVGGPHITHLPESFRTCFDIGVMNEGEDTLCELVQLYRDGKQPTKSELEKVDGIIFWDGSRIIQNKCRKPVDLNNYPLMDYSALSADLLSVRAIGAWGRFGVEAIIESSRGCPFRCIFCASTRFWKRIRYFPVPWVVENLKNLMALGVTHIHLSDDLFAGNKKRLREFAEAFRACGIQQKMQFNISCRASVFDEEFCDLLRDVGCTTIFFGFESGNTRVLKMLKGEQCSSFDNLRSVLICEKKRMECWGAVMIGSPTETESEMMDTVEFIRWCKKHKVRRVCVGITVPFPGTPLWDQCLADGTVSLDMDFNEFKMIQDGKPMLVEETLLPAFYRIKDLANREAHYFKWNKAWTLFKSGPLRVFKFAIHSPWWIIKRMFDPTMP